MQLNHGVFTISLDFELYWGVRDKRSIDQYRHNLQGVKRAIPEILKVFDDNQIHATWASVGFLFFDNRSNLISNNPKLLPLYKKEELCPYKYIKETHDLDSEYHFAPVLIQKIMEYDGQEIGTHTFSHYYCLEEGQSLAHFEEDIISAIEIAKTKGISIKSLVFPRNQWNTEYLSTLRKLGIHCYRGNESSWIYKASDDMGQNKIQRAFRLLDAYVNISGHNTYDLSKCIEEEPYNFPASRSLRPYSKKLSFLDGLRTKRIKNAMTHAAFNNKIFHLWWHPHNFGINLNRNIDILIEIADHYVLLHNRNNMKSLNMGELSLLARGSNGE